MSQAGDGWSAPEVGELAHRLGHELQTPLSGMIMLLTVVRGAPELRDATREHIDRVLGAATRMRHLIQAAVEFADATEREGPFRTVDCAGVLTAAQRELRGREGWDEFVVEADHLPQVRGDRTALRLLFRNLLDNAIRYRGQHPAQVEVSCERKAAIWRFRVADHGIGIEPADRERVFEPLVRLHGYDDIPGSGLGLFLCRQIVTRHGGQIGIEPARGGGTVVWFTLPAVSSVARPSQRADAN